MQITCPSVRPACSGNKGRRGLKGGREGGGRKGRRGVGEGEGGRGRQSGKPPQLLSTNGKYTFTNNAETAKTTKSMHMANDLHIDVIQQKGMQVAEKPPHNVYTLQKDLEKSDVHPA
jgi:hypothetical protein